MANRWLCLLTLITLTGSVAAEPTWPTAVKRRTSDRDADLIAELIRLGRYPEASAVCEFHTRGLDSKTDEAARWAIRRSQVLAAEQMSKSAFDDAQVAIAQRPVAELLAAYPDHRRSLFLKAQQVAVRRDAARHDVVAVAVSPMRSERVDEVMKRLARTTRDLQSLSERIDDARAVLSNQRGTREFALLEDLVRLQQELQVNAVSLSLLQTELFPRGGQDRLAAATSAETAAREAATRLPADSPARREVERLRVEAIIRGQQFDRASTEMIALTRGISLPLPGNIQAMWVRIDLGRERLASAQNRVRSFYGPSIKTAPLSVEMDLARLEVLLSDSGSAGKVGAWLDEIERRDGLYARRRAEAISLGRLREAGVSQAVDPSLVAAQGEDWVRRGQPERAAELFAAAALAEQDADRAIRHAVASAAAYLKADQKKQASDILVAVARAKPDAATAAATHLQAALTYYDSGLPDTTERVRTILKQNLELWPAGDSAQAARAWLIKLFSSEGDYAQAAQAATRLAGPHLTAANLDQAVQLWMTAFVSADPSAVDELMNDFQDAFEPLRKEPAARSAYRSAAACLLDRPLLSDLPPREPTGSPLDAKGDRAKRDAACDQLLAFRQRAAANATIDPPPETLAPVFRWRLMRDGRRYSQMRASIAKTIDGWPNGSQPSLDRAERLIWLGKVSEAEQSVRNLVAKSERSGSTMRQAAELFATSDQESTKAVAVKLWDEFASGIPQRSRQWHEAKLAAIELLRQSGKGAEAQRRAKYILLTAAPAEADLKRRYESVSRP